MTLGEIFNQLKELEIKFNEITYPSEASFQPSFSFKIQKAEKECLKHRFPRYKIEKFFEKVEI